MTERTEVTLATMGGGGLEERFTKAHRELLADCRDPNKPQDKARKITITVKMLPADDRGYVAYEYSVATSKPAYAAGSMVTEVEKRGDELVALCRPAAGKGDPRQIGLDEGPGGTVTPMKRS